MNTLFPSIFFFLTFGPIAAAIFVSRKPSKETTLAKVRVPISKK